MNEISALILAAGSSARLGTPKQLITYRGKTLIERSVENCLSAKIENVLAVLGSSSEKIFKVLEEKKTNMRINHNWAKGMGSSLSFGLKEIFKIWPDTMGVLICLPDQPLVTSSHIENLVELFQESGKSIVASGYDGSFGPPLIFHKMYVNKLLGIKGDKGAKSVLKRYESEILIVDFPGGHLDIDTKEDLDQIRNENG